MHELDTLYRFQETAARAAADEALRAYGVTRNWVMAATGTAFAVGLVVAILVIRRSRQSETTLQSEKERALVTLYSIGESVITTDARGRIEHMNEAAENLVGTGLEQASGMPFLRIARIHHEATRHPATDLLMQALDGTGVGAEVVRSSDDLILLTASGGERAVELTSSPIRDGYGQLIGAVHVLRDVTEMRAMSRELSYHATHDALTGLMNRREFEHRLQLALDLARTQDTAHALCYIDLDMFKVVNDTAGHMAGDELLKQLAQILRARTRSQDIVARLGGDEFGFLLHACPVGFAESVAEDIQRIIREFRFLWDDRAYDIGASIGVVPVTADSGTITDIMRAADLACYAAKDAGRNRLHVFRPDDDILLRREGEMNWIHRVRQALDEERFTLYHQTIEPLHGKLPHKRLCEILIRMYDDDGEIVAAANFLPVAERYQLSPMIDRWVVGRVLDVISRLDAEEDQAACLFNINLSGQSLCDPGFLDFILERLDSTGVPPQRLCFEITETAAISNLTRAQEMITVLEGRGCLFALDDFGSGLSSFGYLKNLPVDFLKIDGTFIRDIVDDETDRALVESINQIGHVMGIRTIAEYVENEDVRKVLEQIGVDYIQGNCVCPPSPLGELLPSAREFEIPTADEA